MPNFWEHTGLRFLNAIANSVPHTMETVTFGDDPRQKLDWYRLKNGPAIRPTVLFFYGGNWRAGNRHEYKFVADTLMTMGCDVALPDYRLYPDVHFKDIITDARLALATMLPVVPERAPLFVMGHSAGAQLGALLTLDHKHVIGAERIAGFVGLAGPYDFYPFTEDDHWDLFAPEDHYPESQPVNFVRADAPPLYLLHGEEDNRVRRGHSKSLMEKQQAIGGKASREVYKGMGHVQIILDFSRPLRWRSPVVKDVADFLHSLST